MYNTTYKIKLCYTGDMLTKGKIQTLKSYHDKKERNKKGVFIVEGEKSVAELLVSNMIITELYITQDFANRYEKELKECGKRHAVLEKWIKPQTVEVGEIAKISTLESVKNTCNAFALVNQFNKEITDEEVIELIKNERVLILDDIRDPGNMGTIIRLADWYGISNIIASIGTVDIYNPKTISASMGSFSRINIIYKNINNIINIANKSKLNIIASTLNGQNANKFTWPKSGALVIGNEANGINQTILENIKNQITLPSYGKAESLNAALACGIFLDRWMN